MRIHPIVLLLILFLSLASPKPALADGQAPVLPAYPGTYVSEAPGCPSPLQISFLAADLALFLRGECKPVNGACPLTPWSPENGASYAELFVDINAGEMITKEGAQVHRFVTRAHADGALSLDWTVSEAGVPVRRLQTRLETHGAGVRLQYDRSVDAVHGPLRLSCDYARQVL